MASNICRKCKRYLPWGEKCDCKKQKASRNPESLLPRKRCPVCGGDYGHVELNRQLKEARLEREKEEKKKVK